ncbi:unnamed protein product [Clavelina lepadiformis]|uniref:Uncharacterized protein n=1 Tax=Clavelina lepadiformis TaxID=159417 RepID=A0ABP0GSB1_CLALP
MIDRTSFRLPFCSPFHSDHGFMKTTKTLYPYNTSAVRNVSEVLETTSISSSPITVWEALPTACRTVTAILGIVFGLLLLISIVSNFMTAASACASKAKKSVTRDDAQAQRKLLKFMDSIWIQSMFRTSMAFSGIFAGGLLLPFSGITIYNLLSSSAFSENVRHQRQQLAEFEKISCAFFHLTLSACIFSMLGAVGDRFYIMYNLNPFVYLEKNSKPVAISSTPTKPGCKRSLSAITSLHGRKTSLYQKLAVIYLVIVWCASVALAILSVTYGDIKFLLFGEELKNNETPIASRAAFVTVSGNYFMEVMLIYLAFVFIPLLCLILLTAIVVAISFKLQSTTEGLDYYEEARMRSFSLRTQRKLLQPCLMGISPQSTAKKESRIKPKNGPDATFSHKAEHSQQVTSNCQESDVNGVATDCIQDEGDGNNIPLTDLKVPLPPDWIRFSSLKRTYTRNSTVQVDDLAATSLTVPIDSSRAFFGELAETRATLITCAFVTLMLLPLCSLLAIDVFDVETETFGQEIGDLNSTSEYLLSSHTAVNLAYTVKKIL